MKTGIAGVVAVLACAGCMSVSTTEVQVRDAAQVALETPKGAPLLPPGASDAVVDRGEVWGLFTREPYVLHATRQPSGMIRLRCDGCEARFASAAPAPFDVLDATGRVRAEPSFAVDIGTSQVAVSLASDCVLYHRSFCEVPAPVRVVVPTTDVVEVRRRVEPFRLWGYMLVAGSAFFLAGATYVAVAPGWGSFGERAPWIGLALGPALAMGGVGLWQILSPAREQVWTPGRAE
jgi:hypothetical protein